MRKKIWQIIGIIVLSLIVFPIIYLFWPVTYPSVNVPETFQGKVTRPEGKMRLYIMQVGYSAKVDYADVVEGAKPQMTELPTFVFLVDHPSGKILIDTGYGTRYFDYMKRFPNPIFGLFIHPVMPEEWALPRQLSRIGVLPEEITHIVLTHAHNDHAGGVQDFPNAKVYLTQEEWKDATNTIVPSRRGFLSPQLEGIQDRLIFVDYKPQTRYGTFEESFDLFGDGAIVLVKTPGHTAGSQSVFIHLPSGEQFFYTGDVAWVAANYQIPAPKSRLPRRILEYDERQVWSELLRVKKLSEIAPRITIIAGHDVTMLPKLQYLPNFYE